MNSVLSNTAVELLFERVNMLTPLCVQVSGTRDVDGVLLQVGSALQPSILYIGDCEKMFKKKVPKTDLVRARLLRDRFQPTNDSRFAVMDVSAASRREKCHQRLRLRLHKLIISRQWCQVLR